MRFDIRSSSLVPTSRSKVIQRAQLVLVCMCCRVIIVCDEMKSQLNFSVRAVQWVGGVFFFSRDGAYMIKTIKVSLLRMFVHSTH